MRKVSERVCLIGTLSEIVRMSPQLKLLCNPSTLLRAPHERMRSFPSSNQMSFTKKRKLAYWFLSPIKWSPFSSQFAEHGLVLWVGTASLWQGRGDGPLESGHSLLARKETLRLEGFVDSITLPSDTWVITESREGLRTKRALSMKSVFIFFCLTNCIHTK